MEEVELEDFSRTLRFLSFFFPQREVISSLCYVLSYGTLKKKLAELAYLKQVTWKETVMGMEGKEVVTEIKGEDLEIMHLIKSQDTLYFIAQYSRDSFHIGKISPEGGELKFLTERSFFYTVGAKGLIECGGDLLFGNGEDLLTIDSESLEIKKSEKYYGNSAKMRGDPSNPETYILYTGEFYLERKNRAGELLLCQKAAGPEIFCSDIVVDFSGKIFLLQKEEQVFILKVFSPDFSLLAQKELNYLPRCYRCLYLSIYGEVYLYSEFGKGPMKTGEYQLHKVKFSRRSSSTARLVYQKLKRTVSRSSVLFHPPQLLNFLFHFLFSFCFSLFVFSAFIFYNK